MSGPPARSGGLAQLGERQLCKLDVTGSIPVSSTSRRETTERSTRIKNFRARHAK